MDIVIQVVPWCRVVQADGAADVLFRVANQMLIQVAQQLFLASGVLQIQVRAIRRLQVCGHDPWLHAERRSTGVPHLYVARYAASPFFAARQIARMRYQGLGAWRVLPQGSRKSSINPSATASSAMDRP
ncbi:hypothetical protein [Ralstonia pseudosolanacearum]|uniref:hypothetical protein n=1 Tax=Ralstonia pseudosolanacearum TaxID=1310165 RepID=UPI001F5B4E14|nr:hypothetical protein [Ralstonia pseudosolanacearum]MDC6283797.1 hypothetical protein [Ralstonia pseudosolanacearum]